MSEGVKDTTHWNEISLSCEWISICQELRMNLECMNPLATRRQRACRRITFKRWIEYDLKNILMKSFLLIVYVVFIGRFYKPFNQESAVCIVVSNTIDLFLVEILLNYANPFLLNLMADCYYIFPLGKGSGNWMNLNRLSKMTCKMKNIQTCFDSHLRWK